MEQFEMKTQNTSTFAKLIDLLAGLLSDARFQISKKGLYFRAMDPSHVMMVELNLPAQAFEAFECMKSQEIKIDIADLNRAMKRGAARDTLRLTKDAQNNKLRIQFIDKSTRTFRIGIKVRDEDDEDEPPKPSLSLNKCTINSGDFSRAIKDAKVFGEYAVMTLTQDNLTVSATGDTGSTDSEIIPLEAPKVKEPQVSQYSLEYLSDILKIDSLADRLELELGTDFPLKVSAKFLLAPQNSENSDEAANKEASAMFLLAPRVEEEDVEDVGAGESESDASAEDESEDSEEDMI